MDEDGNGLDDEAEQQLAGCFVPEFRFDADEPSKSLQPNEPVSGFTAYRIQSPNPANVLIRFRFAFLFRQDGGFASDDDPINCQNPHEGDSIGVTMDVLVYKDVVWRAKLVAFSDGSVPSDGTRAVVYPTAGKHHIRSWAGGSWYDVSVGTKCWENHRGNGAIRVPTNLFRVPFSHVAMQSGDGNIHWGNVCKYVRTGEKEVGQRLQPSRLDNLGFEGQALYGPFYTSNSVGHLLAPDSLLTTDADGDSRDDIDLVDPTDVVATVASDRCPLAGGPQLDEDGDHLVSSCDPDPNFQQTWVGVGTPAKPAVPLAPYWYSSSSFALGGFYDSDQDGAPEGFDGCPSLPPKLMPTGGITASNRWGEDENWPPDPYENNLLGALQRDPMCDPYPVAHTQWNQKTKTFNRCQSAGFVNVGQGAIGLTTRVSRGVSANDSFWSAPKLEPPRSFVGQTYRCACRNRTTGAPLPGAACVLDAESECFRAQATPASGATAVGRGWRPVDRQGCPRDPNGWCTKLSYVVPRFDSVVSSVSWRWLDEATVYGPGSSKPHFAPGDVEVVPGSFTSSAHTRLTHDYATWTLPDIDEPPALPGVAATSYFHDPEYDPLHRAEALWDLSSLPSTRLRASFSEQPVAALVSPHSAFYPGLPCTILTLDQQLVKLELWFGPDPVVPDRTTFADARVLAHDGGLVQGTVLLRAHEGGYAGLVLGPTAAETWLATAPVLVAPINAAPAVQPAVAAAPSSSTRATNAEPNILAIERGGASARWALLQPSSISDTEVQYEQREGGWLSGAVTTAARTVADAAGETAVVIDFGEGWFEVFSPDSHTWTRRSLPAELVGLEGAATAVWGANLLVAGGWRAGAPATELWQLELFSGVNARLRADLPPRREARLSVTPSGESLLLTGGVDPQGVRHDDVWQLVPFERPALRLFSDTLRAAAFDARVTVVFDAPFEGLVRSVGFDTTREALVVSRLRADQGWEEATVAGESRLCPLSDSAGGTLCALGAPWWSSPGRVPCGSSACDGTSGALEAVAFIPGPGAVIDADVDDLSAWVIRAKAVERWRFDAGPHPVLLAKATLPAKARAISVSAAGALVATDAGLSLARSSESGFELGAALPLCGRPLKIERLTETTWAVATTAGLAVVAGGTGSPLELRSMSSFEPAGPSATPPSHAAADCKAATESAADGLSGVTSLAHIGERLLIASGGTLYEVAVRDPDAPSVRSVLPIQQPLAALRADALGLRAYAVAPSSQHRTAFDLRGDALVAAGTHELAAWTRRRDSGRLRIRVASNKAELARIAP